jgi:hypothetical protein
MHGGDMDRKNTDEAADGRSPADAQPDTIDPAPWLGQVGEGATLQSGEVIARQTRELTDEDDPRGEDRPVSSDPEMPIPDVNDRNE